MIFNVLHVPWSFREFWCHSSYKSYLQRLRFIGYCAPHCVI